jgi:LCP family protein required for cell wall assembly
VGLVAAALVVLGASYLWVSCEVEGAQITDPTFLTVLESTPSSVVGTPSGTDILLLGTDKHPDNQGEYVRSDSMMLVHVDPELNYLSFLSLPRDLRVEVPGYGTQKLNWAYSKGGAELAVQTVEALTSVDIKEYVEVDFQAFQDITEELGGVYIDVDCRYFNPDPQYELIDIYPGYQTLAGEDALDYVRYRLDSNMDFGRMHRQQRFITALREQALGWDLAFKAPALIRAFFDNTETTLDTDDITELVFWAVSGLDSSRIKQVALDNCYNETIDGVWYVIAAAGALEEAVQDFVTAPEPGAPAASTTVATVSTTEPETTDGSEGPTTSHEDVSADFITDPDEIADSELWHELATKVPFQVMAPGYLPEGYEYVDRYPPEGYSTYDLVVGDEVERGLKLVYQLTRDGEKVDQYLGIMETTWLEAPAAAPGREVEYNGTVFTVVGTAQSIERVWWKRDGVLYWVSNTLSYMLHSSELIKVAESMIPMPRGDAD